ncbi:hypothetical protein ACLQ28_18140 [Micromonospora sp. DT201]|uniref:hypothetical protein n=1 Tax=Micromonospora sp. DT201 TaxID=3393442 RepID=UPI003CFAB15B
MSSLAAPAFAAAMMGRQVIDTISVGRRVLLVADLPVGDAKPLADVAPLRLLALAPRDGG